MDQYHLQGNKMFYEDCKVLHKGEVEEVLAQFHDHSTATHQNEKTMLQHIKKRYVSLKWQTMFEYTLSLAGNVNNREILNKITQKSPSDLKVYLRDGVLT